MAVTPSAESLISTLSRSWIDRYRAESQSTDWGQTLAMYGLLRGSSVVPDAEVDRYLRTWLLFHLNESLHIHYFCGSWSFGLLYPEVTKRFPEAQIGLRSTAEKIYHTIMKKALRNGDGVILHNVDLPNIYIDTIYYSSVLLAKIGTAYHLPWEEEALTQFAKHLAVLRDGDKPFFIHCEQNLSGLRSEGSWARGNGWVMMTYAELLTYLPKTSGHYKRLRKEFIGMATVLAAYQTKSGLWRTIIDDRSSYEESSASAMYLFAYKRGQNLGILGKEFDKTIQKAYDGLAKMVDNSGRFLGASEGTWPGTIEYYKSLSTGEWWWGTGAYLLALSEFIEKKRK